MRNRVWLLGVLVLIFPSFLFADIVWQGKRVGAWPAEAMPSSKANAHYLAKTTATTTSSHYAAPKGKIYGLTLLVDFSDNTAPFTTSEISDWLNKEGFDRDGCNGSVRDYYLDVSNGQFDLTNEVFGWYRAKHPKSWYEGLSEYTGSDSLVKEVFEYFDSQVDYSRYDNDGDGTTEAISIVYAGSGGVWGKGLWPHSGWSDEVRDGVNLTHHQMTDMPGSFSIYVFVHESGHMIFGWPDLYWYGDYCTMGNRASETNPVAINDFYRADQGWIPFEDVTSADKGIDSSAAGEKMWRYRNPSRSNEEGLVWSYVRNTGRQSVLAGSGILLQHYDFSIEGNSSAESLGLRIVHADSAGKNSDAEQEQWPSGSDAAAFFKAGDYAEFSDALYPATRWYSGSETGLVFSNVGVPGNKITLCLGGDCSAPTTAFRSARKSPELHQGRSMIYDVSGKFVGIKNADGAAPALSRGAYIFKSGKRINF